MLLPLSRVFGEDEDDEGGFGDFGGADESDEDGGTGFGGADESDEEDEAPKAEPKKEEPKVEEKKATGGDAAAIKKQSTKKKKKNSKKKAKGGSKKEKSVPGGGANTVESYAKENFRPGTSAVYEHPGLGAPLTQPVTMIPGPIDQAKAMTLWKQLLTFMGDLPAPDQAPSSLDQIRNLCKEVGPPTSTARCLRRGRQG